MITIGSNIVARRAERTLAAASDSAATTLERLASGLRINRASDDAAGLAISSTLNANARVYSQAIRNGGDAISALSIAEGTVSQLSTILIRIKELATQAASGSFSRVQRLALDDEAEQLNREFNRLTASAFFNGISLLSGSMRELRIQLGFGTEASLSASLGAGLSRSGGTLSFSGTTSGSVTTGGFSGGGSTQLADINGDGLSDMVVLFQDGDTPLYEVRARLSNGDGTFADETTLVSLGTTSISQVNVGDFNGDGRADLMVGHSNTYQLYTGNGAGSFSAGASTSSGLGALTSQSVVDINGDGVADLVGRQGSSAVVIMGSANGSLSSTTMSLGNTGALAFADVNGDGRLDLVQARGASGVRTWAGNGDGTFSSTGVNTTGFTASGIDARDINFDGIADLVTYSGTSARVAFGLGDGSFGNATTLTPTGTISQVAIRDMDGDGVPDLLFRSGTAGTAGIRVYRGNGDGTFESAVTTLNSTITSSLRFGDIDGDGVTDVTYQTILTGVAAYALGGASETTSGVRVDLTSQASARAALSTIEAAILRTQRELGFIGAAQSRIGIALGTLAAARENSLAAAGRIQDVDVASESANAVRLQILRQVGSAVLGQANQAPVLALSLLRSS